MKRPVVVISHDAFNRTAGWQSVIVIPISTSSSQGRRGPTAIEIPAGRGGLSKTGFALCHQVTTLDRAKLARRIGILPPDAVRKTEAGLKAALDLT